MLPKTDSTNLRRNNMAQKKLQGEERIIDLLERLGSAFLYQSTDMNQKDVARVLGIDNTRANELLKNVKKQK